MQPRTEEGRGGRRRSLSGPLEGLEFLDSIHEGRLRIEGQCLLGDHDGLREVAVQEMDLAFLVARRGIDRAVGACFVEDHLGFVELTVMR